MNLLLEALSALTKGLLACAIGVFFICPLLLLEDHIGAVKPPVYSLLATQLTFAIFGGLWFLGWNKTQLWMVRYRSQGVWYMSVLVTALSFYAALEGARYALPRTEWWQTASISAAVAFFLSYVRRGLEHVLVRADFKRCLSAAVYLMNELRYKRLSPGLKSCDGRQAKRIADLVKSLGLGVSDDQRRDVIWDSFATACNGVLLDVNHVLQDPDHAVDAGWYFVVDLRNDWVSSTKNGCTA